MTKIHAIQAGSPEFRSPEPTEKPVRAPQVLVPQRQKQKDPSGHWLVRLANQ